MPTDRADPYAKFDIRTEYVVQPPAGAETDVITAVPATADIPNGAKVAAAPAPVTDPIRTLATAGSSRGVVWAKGTPPLVVKSHDLLLRLTAGGLITPYSTASAAALDLKNEIEAEYGS
jgi:hypothetical protein